MGRARRTNRPGQRLTPSAKMYVFLETVAAVLCILFVAASVITLAVDEQAGKLVFGTLFWAIAIAAALAIMLGVGQLLRGFDFLSAAGLAVTIASVAMTAALIVFECVAYGKFFVVPFTIV